MKVKGFALDTYDGIAGLFTQPYIGARDEGVTGALKGLAKGIAGVPVKFFAGKSPRKHTLRLTGAKQRRAPRSDTLSRASTWRYRRQPAGDVEIRSRLPG